MSEQPELFETDKEDTMTKFQEHLSGLNLDTAVVIGFSKDQQFHLLASSGSLADVFMYSNLAINSASKLIMEGTSEDIREDTVETTKVLN